MSKMAKIEYFFTQILPKNSNTLKDLYGTLNKRRSQLSAGPELALTLEPFQSLSAHGR